MSGKAPEAACERPDEREQAIIAPDALNAVDRTLAGVHALSPTGDNARQHAGPSLVELAVQLREVRELLADPRATSGQRRQVMAIEPCGRCPTPRRRRGAARRALGTSPCRSSLACRARARAPLHPSRPVPAAGSDVGEPGRGRRQRRRPLPPRRRPGLPAVVAQGSAERRRRPRGRHRPLSQRHGHGPASAASLHRDRCSHQPALPSLAPQLGAKAHVRLPRHHPRDRPQPGRVASRRRRDGGLQGRSRGRRESHPSPDTCWTTAVMIPAATPLPTWPAESRSFSSRPRTSWSSSTAMRWASTWRNASAGLLDGH